MSLQGILDLNVLELCEEVGMLVEIRLNEDRILHERIVKLLLVVVISCFPIGLRLVNVVILMG